MSEKKPKFIVLLAVVVLIVALFSGQTTTGAEPLARNPCPGFKSLLTVGGQGIVADSELNNLRDGMASPRIIAQIPIGGIFNVLEGPYCVTENSVTWWRVEYNGITGWTAEGRGTSEHWLDKYPADDPSPSPGGTCSSDEFTRAIERCEGMMYDYACYGRDVINPYLRSGATANQFDAPGDTLSLDYFDAITTGDQGLTVVVLRPTNKTPVKLVFYGSTWTTTSDFRADPPFLQVEADGSLDCESIPSGVMATTTGGTGNVIINNVELQLASEVLITPTGSSACPLAASSRLQQNMSARVAAFADGTPTRLRDEPLGRVIDLLPEGVNYQVDIIDGPRCTPGLTWWRVRTQEGQVGWVAEGTSSNYFVEPASTPAYSGDWMTITYLSGNVQYRPIGGAFRTLGAGQQIVVDFSPAVPVIYGPYPAPQQITGSRLVQDMGSTLEAMRTFVIQ